MFLSVNIEVLVALKLLEVTVSLASSHLLQVHAQSSKHYSLLAAHLDYR